MHVLHFRVPHFQSTLADMLRKGSCYESSNRKASFLDEQTKVAFSLTPSNITECDGG